MTATLLRARDSGQAVGDHVNGLVRDELCHGALYHGLVLRVYVCRSFVPISTTSANPHKTGTFQKSKDN